MLFCFHVSFMKKGLLPGHSAIKPRTVECCSDGCPSGSFSHLHTGSLELNLSDHRVLGHLSYQGPSPLIAQFGWVPSSRSAGCSKLLTFKNYGGHCALGNLQCSRNIYIFSILNLLKFLFALSLWGFECRLMREK